MTEIILKNIPDDYFDIFTSDLYNNSQERELNWIEKDDRKKRDSKVHPTENGQEIIK